jgi:hypothetical protein
MLIVDDILTFPVRGLVWVFEEIRDAAEQALRDEAGAITVELQQLYSSLEKGQITEDEFERREAELLDKLDELHEQ